uniref:Uncharacterized protein n=1 Tax=Rhizophora mucronata TaxID=61149 RepID=A0A2P2PMN4_RHIMU
MCVRVWSTTHYMDNIKSMYKDNCTHILHTPKFTNINMQ